MLQMTAPRRRRRRRWTTARRARALLACPRTFDVDHEISLKNRSISIIESVLHECAHAVVLGPAFENEHDLGGKTSDAIYKLRGTVYRSSTRAWIWQEILALAAEAIVLRDLGLPYHKKIVYTCDSIEDHYAGWAFIQLVERAQQTKATHRRVKRVMALFNKLCEEGQDVIDAESQEAVPQLPVPCRGPKRVLGPDSFPFDLSDLPG